MIMLLAAVVPTKCGSTTAPPNDRNKCMIEHVLHCVNDKLGRTSGIPV